MDAERGTVTTDVWGGAPAAFGGEVTVNWMAPDAGPVNADPSGTTHTYTAT